MSADETQRRHDYNARVALLIHHAPPTWRKMIMETANHLWPHPKKATEFLAELEETLREIDRENLHRMRPSFERLRRVARALNRKETP